MSVAAQIPNAAEVPELTQTRSLKPPTGIREPVKVNIYERMAKSNAQLMPIFPYDEAGTMVPCGAMLYGGSDREHGQFFHWNTVSEVLVSWGTHEAMIPAGAIMATQPFHGVNSFLKDERNPEAYALATITQRQSDEPGQREALTAKCQKCRKDLLVHEYDAPPAGAPDHDPERFGHADDVVRQFPTQVAGVEFVEMRNSEAGLECQACGFVNPEFPTKPWGWGRLVNQTRVANAAYRALRDSDTKGGG
jgi:hypothetical protein